MQVSKLGYSASIKKEKEMKKETQTIELTGKKYKAMKIKYIAGMILSLFGLFIGFMAESPALSGVSFFVFIAFWIYSIIARFLTWWNHS